MSYNERKFLMRATFVALLGAMFGCGEVTPFAPDGGGGAAGRETLNAGGASGAGGEGSASGAPGAGGGQLAGTSGTGGGQAGGTLATGGAVGTGGIAGAPSTGGFGGSQIDAGAGDAVVMTIDAGSSDGAACPRSIKTMGLQGNSLTTLNGTSTGIRQSSCSATGGGPVGSEYNCALSANLVAMPDPNNPSASSTGSVIVPFVQDCNGNYQSDEDLNLQGYVFSLWVYVQGLPCNTDTTQLGWRVGVVSNSGITFPWTTDVGVLSNAACTGAGTTIHWTSFPAGALGHAIVLQFLNESTQQAFSGIIDVSEVELTFK